MARARSEARGENWRVVVNSTARKIPPWTLYVLGAAWGGWLFFLGLTGRLGVEPVETLEHLYGELALQLLIAGLAITPLCQWVRINLMAFRRAVGLLAFFFALAHVLVWAFLDVQALAAIWADIMERPYVTVGFGAFLLLIPLAVTSNNWSIRKMGAMAWRRLHKAVYPAAILAAIHYVWLARGFQIEPLFYLTLIVSLLLLRKYGGRASRKGKACPN